MAQLSAIAPFRFHRAWTILVILIVVQVIGQAISMSAGIMVPLLKDPEGAFGWNIFTVSAAIALYYLIGSLMSPIAGMMGDRFGSRPIMFACGALYLVSMLFVGIVSQTWHFFIAFGVFLAITQAFTFVPLQASIGGWFRRRLGLATGLLQGAGGIGSALLAPAVAVLLDAVGWRETFWFIAFLGGGLIILCSIFFRSKPADANIRPYGMRGDEPPDVTPPVELLKLRLKVFGQHMRRTRAFWNLPFIHFLGCMGHAIVIWHVVFFATEQGLSLAAAAWIVTIYTMASVSSRLFIPILADQFGAKATMVLPYALQGVTVVMLFWAQSAWEFYLFAVLFGIGFGGEMSAFLIANRQYYGMGPVRSIFGFQHLGSGFGMAIGGLVGGVVYDFRNAEAPTRFLGFIDVGGGSYDLAWIISIVASLAGVLFILLLESSSRVLIPDWEDSLPAEAQTSPASS
jgi:MFS family permease